MWSILGLTLVLGYPLSAGPMLFLAMNGYFPAFLGDFPLYGPLVSLGKQFEPFGKLFDWYLSQWVKL